MTKEIKTPKQITEDILSSLRIPNAPEGILMEMYFEMVLKQVRVKLLEDIYHEIDTECISETDTVRMETISNVFAKYGAKKENME